MAPKTLDGSEPRVAAAELQRWATACFAAAGAPSHGRRCGVIQTPLIVHFVWFTSRLENTKLHLLSAGV
jgi:hypothetical protein